MAPHGNYQPASNRDQSSASSLSSGSHQNNKISGYTQMLQCAAKVADKYLNDLGFHVTQHNGQRVSVLKGVELPDDKICREVFVGKLPRDMLEFELMPAMLKIGPVYKMRLMMDFSCGNRGYAFVVFINPEDATKACELLNNTLLRPNSEKQIGVCPSFDNRSLWMGNLPASMSREKLVTALRNIVEGIETVRLPECTMKRGSRYAVVTFKTHEDATKARRVLCPGTVRVMGHKIAVDWAKPDKPAMRPATNQPMITKQQENLIPLAEPEITIAKQPIGTPRPAVVRQQQQQQQQQRQQQQLRQLQQQYQQFESQPILTGLDISRPTFITPIGQPILRQQENQFLSLPEINNNNIFSPINHSNMNNISTPAQQTIGIIDPIEDYFNSLRNTVSKYR